MEIQRGLTSFLEVQANQGLPRIFLSLLLRGPQCTCSHVSWPLHNPLFLKVVGFCPLSWSPLLPGESLGLNLGDDAAAWEQLEERTCRAPDSDVLKLFPGITARVSGLLPICLCFSKPLCLHAQLERTQSLSPRGGLSEGTRIVIVSM